jgi:hypothetical protein
MKLWSSLLIIWISKKLINLFHAMKGVCLGKGHKVTLLSLSRGGVWLALIVVLSHFPELEVKLDLLGSGYNADLSCDEMQTLWTRTDWALESLSSWVPPSGTCSPPNDARE